MRHYSRQLLQQDVVKVAVKVEEVSAAESFSPQWIVAIGAGTIALYYGLQLLTTASLG